jgi:hypothetical protein
VNNSNIFARRWRVSTFEQYQKFNRQRLLPPGKMPTRHRLQQVDVMSDASVFRLFAEEAMRGAANAPNEDEKRALEELSCTWAQAALMSDRVFGRGVPPSMAQLWWSFPPEQSWQVRNTTSGRLDRADE